MNVVLFVFAYVGYALAEVTNNEFECTVEEPEDYRSLITPIKPWPNGVVYYELTKDLRGSEEIIRKSMDYIENRTCVKFSPRTSERYYVLIGDHGKCSSEVGFRGSVQSMSLASGCRHIRTIVHEFIHALGFHHEQARFDRDIYINVLWENIKTNATYNFQKQNPRLSPQFYGFDYESIMLYGSFSFSKNSKPTMLPLKYNRKYLKEKYDKAPMSQTDIRRIRTFYKCG